MDPYKVLKVNKNCNLAELRAAFKKIAIKVHPDKGGNEEIFNVVVEAYKSIFNTLKAKEADKSFMDLKNDSTKWMKSKSQSNKHVSFADDVNLNASDEKFQRKFNRVFDDNRMEDAHSRGYGSMMSSSTPIREDYSISKIKNFSDFNSIFDSQECTNKELTVYKEPEPLSLSKSLKYDELGIDKIDDFSSDSTKSKSLGYSDYMRAHTTNKLIDKSNIKVRTSFKNLNDAKSKRSSQRFDLTDEDKQRIEENERRENFRERRRQQLIAEHDDIAAKHFKKLNKIMLR